MRLWDGEELTLDRPGGTLRAVYATPPGPPQGTIFVLPGRAEFLEKYTECARWLNSHDQVAIGLDWRGQGGSSRLPRSGQRGHIDDYASYLQDLDHLIARAAVMDLPRPWRLLAHSMGGHIALRWLIDHPDRVRSAILIAPMLDITFNLPRLLVHALTRVAVRAGLTHAYAPGQRGPGEQMRRFERNPLSSCPERFTAWRALLDRHPERLIGGVTWGWLSASLRSISELARPGSLERVKTPVLICLAEEERIVCNRAIERVVARLPGARLVRFPGARHDLLWERQEICAAVLATISEFIDNDALARQASG